jgi:hypothetical protein
MKKSLYFIGSLLIIIFLSGCGSSGVICSSNANSNGIKIEQKYILNHSKDTITNIEVRKSYSFKDKQKFESFGTVINYTISNMETIKNDHIKFSSKKGSKSYSTRLVVDMKKITDEELTTLGLNKKLSEFKATLENQGLVCK